MKRILGILIMIAMLFNNVCVMAFGEGKELNIVYLRGSITQGAGASSVSNCWASMVTARIVDGITVIPLRALVESMGCTVEWDEKGYIYLQKGTI